MFARINSIQIDPAKLTEMKAAMPAVGAKRHGHGYGMRHGRAMLSLGLNGYG